MNKLSLTKRVQILQLMVEGSALRSIARITGVSINTVYSLLSDAGLACEVFHNQQAQNLICRYVQCDEAWSFLYAKQKRISKLKRQDVLAGDIWTWNAIDVDTRFIVSRVVGNRTLEFARRFMADLNSRLAWPCQLSTDAHQSYLQAVIDTFGDDIDYAQVTRSKDDETRIKTALIGYPDIDEINNTYVERQHLTMRMSMKRYSRKTNAHSKKYSGHCDMTALYFTYYNWCRVHESLDTTPAVEMCLADNPLSIAFIAELIDRIKPPPKKRGPYKKRVVG